MNEESGFSLFDFPGGSARGSVAQSFPDGEEVDPQVIPKVSLREVVEGAADRLGNRIEGPSGVAGFPCRTFCDRPEQLNRGEFLPRAL